MSYRSYKPYVLALALFALAIISAAAQTAQVQVVFTDRLGPLDIDKMALAAC